VSSDRAREVRLAQELLSGGPNLDRRGFFVSAAAFGAAAAGIAASNPAQAQSVPQSGAVPPLAGKLALHARDPLPAPRARPTFVKDLSRLVDLNGTNQGGAYWSYSTYITPIADFYIRNEYDTPRPEIEPRVNKATWRLRIHGDGVERALTISYDDLLKMPSRSIICTMECAGNGRSLFWEQQGMLSGPTSVGGTGWGLGGIGQAEWQYVPISHILGLVGLKRSAQAMLLWSGVDNKSNTPGAQGDTGRPLPISTVLDLQHVMGLAFKMNGEDLPADHGGPVRAIVPGYCGAASTKWLTEIKVSTRNFWVRLNTKAHVMIGPDYAPPAPSLLDEFRFVGPADILGQAVTWSPPKSLITVPLVLEKQPKHPHNYPLQAGQRPTVSAGDQLMRGYAWAPRYGVRKVEYRIDGGGWDTARIELPNLGRFTWVRFDFPWKAETGRHVIETRVTDRKDNVQPVSVPYNQGGFDFWAIPRFEIDVEA
jgi:sulfane dehydrogenase subunit SoxC